MSTSWSPPSTPRSPSCRAPEPGRESRRVFPGQAFTRRSMPSKAKASPTLSAVPAADSGAAAASGGVAQDAPVLGGLASAVALALTMFVEAVGYGVVAPTLPFLARSAGAGDAQIGFLVGLYASVGLLAGIPFGVLANRFGRRSLVLVGLGGLTFASFGCV